MITLCHVTSLATQPAQKSSYCRNAAKLPRLCSPPRAEAARAHSVPTEDAPSPRGPAGRFPAPELRSGAQRPGQCPDIRSEAPERAAEQGAGRAPRGAAQRSRCSSSPGTHAPSRHGLCFPETGTRSRHLINSHLTDSSVRLPTLTKVLNYCSCRFLLHLRHQHSPCDREAQHPHYPP